MKVAFISDLHIGADEFQRENELLEFLKYCRELDSLFIIGDAIDLWRDSLPGLMSKYKKIFASLSLLKKAIYVVGNHDYLMRKFVGQYGNVEIVYPDYLVDINGYKVYMTHGHLQALEWRKLFGLKLMNLYLKIGDTGIAPIIGDFWYKKPVQKLIANFTKSTSGRNDKTVAHLRSEAFKLANENKADIVLSGHTHFQEIIQKHSIFYVNTGSWIGEIDGIPNMSYAYMENSNIELRNWGSS